MNFLCCLGSLNPNSRPSTQINTLQNLEAMQRSLETTTKPTSSLPTNTLSRTTGPGTASHLPSRMTTSGGASLPVSSTSGSTLPTSTTPGSSGANPGTSGENLGSLSANSVSSGANPASSVLPPVSTGRQGASSTTVVTGADGISAEFQETVKERERQKCAGLVSQELLDELKRDLDERDNAPKPWDSAIIRELLLIRKDGTKIEQDFDGNILGDDDEAVMRRNEMEIMKRYREEQQDDDMDDLPLPLCLDNDDGLGDLTEDDINNLLEEFGSGPPQIENLPIMPDIGLKIKPGPDWMWKCNGVDIFDVGIVTSIDETDRGQCDIGNVLHIIKVDFCVSPHKQHGDIV